MKPQILSRLVHGKLICKAVYATFVETFNWLVAANDNICGDWDLNKRNGFIRVDKSDPERPVVRLMNTDKLGGSVGGFSGEKTVWKEEVYNENDDHKLVVRRETWTFSNGVLVNVEDGEDLEVFTAVPHQAHD